MIRGGRSYVLSPPAFSNDAKRLLVCTSNSVTIFSTATGLPVASLDGHAALVTAVIVVPASTPASKIICYCWTASLDGTIRYWDFSVPELIKIINVNLPIISMVIPTLLSQTAETNEKSPKTFAYLSVENTKEPEKESSKALRGQIKKFNLTNSRMAGGMTLTETKQPEIITVSSSGKYFGIRFKRKLQIWKVPTAETERAMVKKVTLHHTKNMNVLAFHPTQRIVAAGDVTGRILIWRGFGDRTFADGDGLVNGMLMNNEEERPGVRGDDDADSCTTWHWHSAEVNVLFFSSDGAYLYSGGKEGVLVVWQLDTGRKKFLPRIGSPLLWLTDSPDPSLSSISCADNQIHLLKMPSMEILKSISGIKLPCSFPEMCNGLQSGIAFDCNAGLVALRTENYCIQLYSLFDDRGVSEVVICERNHQPGDEVTVVVTLAVLSLDGSMMSTAEVKLPEEGLGGLVCLKFWALGSQNKEFSLSTIIYEPHRDAGISAIAFHPTRPMAVSSSYGGDFKVWVCNNGIQEKDQPLSNSGWTCHAVGSYKKKPMTAATFSSDGSVLAVAAETVITLWDADKNILVAVIGETLMPVVNLSFVGTSEYLVSASRGSKPQLSIWSMSKLCVSWSYMLHVEAIASAADMSSFAALALLPESSKCNEISLKGRDGVILLFNASDPVPIFTWSVNKAKGGALAFIQANQSSIDENELDGKPPQSLLAYINGDHEYLLFDPQGKEAKEHSAIQQEGLGDLEEAGKFGYASIYGELPQFDPKRKQASWVPSAPLERAWETVFSGSSHNLPPLTKLCSVFLESLLEKRSANVD
ncbi:TRANSDUCIN FAMILY PROTEIN / WD-40 REPEAT FAMILY PROTEIN-RELATED [Salix viminalis]|uniref:TRANSDUCIN FAMILY PROTEIN / WD-40 REPEAT FAMILY PROTEIN-RELATED n=1 Tax=Salix viminalis TaxID=40686 RepID=A0A6N2N4R4_SALVM|nr:TRANSDUCIN FAMILY PROTEIN / WD-40 REPEAT FAMILY PROTEIN-RELATED [Salix viminalis]